MFFSCFSVVFCHFRFLIDFNFEKINAVYCEGGGTLAHSLLVSGNVDYLFKYRSPKIFENKMSLPGPGFEEFPINAPIEQKLGEDLLIHGFL